MENDLAENLISWIEDKINWVIKQVVVESNDKHWKGLLKRTITDLARWWNKTNEEMKNEQKEEDKNNFRITSVDVQWDLTKIISLETIKNLIVSFFENFKVWDLYLELAEIHRNKMIMDNQEFYLYFGDIAYEKNKYPIFYIPIKLEKNWESFDFIFWSQIYVNKKALEYIVQEYNLKTWNSTHLKNVWERIMYVADWKEINSKKMQDILDETIELLKLNQRIEFTKEERQVSKWEYAQISNNCYICLFDKSDEALINDYEEIITKLNEWDSALWNWFSNLINDFIYKDPKKVTFEIKSEWEDRELCDKLVAHCPIPLNQEQQQIVEATKREDCKYIIVQGPPGTWKSHTITAVVFDQILKWNSVLVLSDKKEALDVVEDKITETMNTVRINDDFQNPILRLWKTGNTYAEILSQQHIEKIINSYFVARWKQQQLKETMVNKTQSLKRKITLENEWYKNILIQDIKDFFLLKDWLNKHWVDLGRVDLADSDVYSDLKLFKDLFSTIQNLVDGTDGPYKEILSLVNIKLNSEWSLKNISSKFLKLEVLLKNIETLKNNYDVSIVKEFWFMDKGRFERLKELSLKYERERSAIFGYLFKKKLLLEIRKELEDELWYASTWNYDRDVQNLRKMIKLINKSLVLEHNDEDFDYIRAVFNILKHDELYERCRDLVSDVSSLDKVQTVLDKYPWIFEILWISWSVLSDLKWVKVEKIFDERFDKLLEYLWLNTEINQRFSVIEDFDYNWEKQGIEKLATIEMTHMMDESLTKFYEEKKNTAMSIKKIIQKKVKFPKEEFLVLKNAFPCILAWIRDYAEFIPLEPDMFDIVIIDEASQVSIAQAFPALLRAKKMLVLWDKKQFSNVKTSLASIKENREYLNKIRDSFVENISNNEILLEKSEMFNIKNSILDFCERICNYEMMLKKYFRWYKEIISYSNKTFYWNGLQVMKIRWKNIDDVLRFEFIDATWKDKIKENTNSKEIEFIIEELKKLKESWIKKSVWIITPHTNQQKALEDAISAVPWSDYFYEKFNLKIMTFDSCQWEERDVIYYSMVATREEDNLWWVFIKDLASVDDEENWILKSQRLNVWFSRPKESIVFVLSKPIDEFSGEIRKTLNHFWEERENNLKNSMFLSNIENSDYDILKLLSQTDFYHEHKDVLKVIPNFDLGSYLKQLDPYYNHPEFKQDFFIVYTNEKWKETKIIFEYDNLNSAIENWDSDLYVSENDIYMEKVLESYWYKFIRLNEFSLWNNKVDTLNQKMKFLIWEKVEKKSDDENGVVDEENDWAILEDMQIIMKWLEDWTFKICEKCGEVKEIEKFRDNTLKSWYWRQCLDCKQGKRWSLKRRIANSGDWSPRSCPICWSKMVLRHSRYGAFYGCSRYPRCLGIVSIKKGKYISF